ncbi:hypothetical protein D1872_305920 [compost metagenome]
MREETIFMLLQKRVQLLFQGLPCRLSEKLAHELLLFLYHFLVNFHKQRFFGCKMVGKGLFANPGFLGNLGHFGALVPEADKMLYGNILDSLFAQMSASSE